MRALRRIDPMDIALELVNNLENTNYSNYSDFRTNQGTHELWEMQLMSSCAAAAMDSDQCRGWH